MAGKSAQSILKGYKQTDVGVIPDDWDVKQLGDIGKCLIGLTYKPSDVVEHGVLVLRSSNIQDDNLALEDNVYVDTDIPERIRVKTDDILICVRNGSRDLIGKCVLLDSRVVDETFGAFMSVFRTPYPPYVFQQFRSNNIQSQIHKHLGATINQITNKSLNSFAIPFPSSAKERSNIVSVLFDTDALIESLEKLIAKKRAIKQAAMQELLTGKRRLPGSSGEWSVKNLEMLGQFRSGSGFPIRYQGEVEGIYPFFKVSDMNKEGNSTFMSTSNNWISEGTRKAVGAKTFPIHTVVFAKIGAAIFLERKKILSQNSCIDNNMMGFVLNEDQAHYRFVHYMLLNIKFGQFVSATALPSLNGRELAQLEFHVPSLPEQAAIAKVIADMDTENVALEQRLKKHKLLKQGMMQVLLTGKVRLV